VVQVLVGGRNIVENENPKTSVTKVEHEICIYSCFVYPLLSGGLRCKFVPQSGITRLARLDLHAIFVAPCRNTPPCLEAVTPQTQPSNIQAAQAMTAT
jgi:hypothetical protein